MIKILKENEVDKIIDDCIIITSSSNTYYYKNKYYGKNYYITTFKNFIMDSYKGGLSYANAFHEFIFMLKAFLSVKDDLKRYQDFSSYSFINDLLKTYENYDEYDLNINDKTSDLNKIYTCYEALLNKNGLANFKMILNKVKEDVTFNSSYLFLDLEYLDYKEFKIFEKMCEEADVYVAANILNNKNLCHKLSGVSKEVITCDSDNYLDGKKVTFKALNDVPDELSFVLNDISKKVREGNKYSDFAIVSNDINTYFPYFDLVFDIPYSKKSESGVLTTRFISLFAKLMNGDFSCLNFINLLKLGLFDIDSSLVDKLDNYVYSWDLEKENFYKTFTFNPSGNRSFKELDYELLDKLNKVKEDIISPIKYLLENISGETNVNVILKWFYTYIEEEKIDERLEKSDPKGLSNFITLLEVINDYLDYDMNVSDLFNLISSVNLIDKKGNPVVDEVLVTNLKDATYKDKKFVYLIGASEDVLPKAFKLSNLISPNDIKKDNLIKLVENFELEENYNLFKALNNDDVTVTYHKLSIDKRLKNLAGFLSMIDLITNDDERIYNPSLIKNDYALNLSQDKITQSKLQIFKSINSSNNHDLDKKITNESAKKLYNNNLVLSPSSIEAYSKCCFYHFCQYGLKLNIKEKHLFDSREVGTFVHYVLEKIIKNDFENISLSNLDELIKKYATNYLEDNNKIINNATLYVINYLSKNVSFLLKNMIKEQEISKFKPSYFEFKIGDNEVLKPIEVKLLDGKLKVIGTIDRVDVCEDDDNYYYRVIDYKTGNKKFRLDDVLAGLNLQMLLYVLAIKQSGGSLTNKKVVPSGFFYYPSILKEKISSRECLTDDLELSISDRLKMNGMLNYDKSVLDASGNDEFFMYADVSSRGKINEEKIFGLDNLEKLFKNIEEQLFNAGNDILNGKISVNPSKKDIDSCSYCKFKSVCKFDDTIDKKKNEKCYSNKEVFDMLEGDKNA